MYYMSASLVHLLFAPFHKFTGDVLFIPLTSCLKLGPVRCVARNGRGRGGGTGRRERETLKLQNI